MTRRINLMTADSKALMSVKGIGEKTANKIIEARNEGVEFGSMEELKRVVSYSRGFEAEIADAFGLGPVEARTDASARPSYGSIFDGQPGRQLGDAYIKPNDGSATEKGFEFTIVLSGLSTISPKRINGVIEWARSSKTRSKIILERMQLRFDAEARASVRLSEAEHKARTSMEFKLVLADVKGNVINTSMHRPENGDMIEVELERTEVLTPQALKIKAKKANNVDYTGYSLSWTLTERVPDRLNDRSGTFKLASANETTVQPLAGSEV